jgi:hypothetical protein
MKKHSKYGFVVIYIEIGLGISISLIFLKRRCFTMKSEHDYETIVDKDLKGGGYDIFEGTRG